MTVEQKLMQAIDAVFNDPSVARLRAAVASITPERDMQMRHAIASLRRDRIRLETAGRLALWDVLDVQDELRRRHRLGDSQAAADALAQYLQNGIPLEDWAIDAIQKALRLPKKLAPLKRGAKGRLTVKQVEAAIHEYRVQLKRGMSTRQAADRVRRKLKLPVSWQRVKGLAYERKNKR